MDPIGHCLHEAIYPKLGDVTSLPKYLVTQSCLTLCDPMDCSLPPVINLINRNKKRIGKNEATKEYVSKKQNARRIK